MNTIKFSKNKNLTTEQHDMIAASIKNENIFGQELLIYNPCNLNIFITSVCQNKCDFCINNKFTGSDCSDEIYEKSLKEVLDEKDFEITITGGEPTLNMKRLIFTMKECFDRNLHCRTFSTTGFNLLKEYENKQLWNYLIDYNFVHNINISRMNIDQNINDNIFGNKNITNKDIEKLAYFFGTNNAEMRISCNLIKGSIDSFKSMLNFVDFYSNIGVQTVMFRETIGYDLKFSNILNFDENFKKIEQINGPFYMVDVYEYKDYIVKHYITKTDIDKNIISSFSLRNGVFTDGFGGKKIERTFI